MKKTILLWAMATLVCNRNAPRHAYLRAALGLLAALAAMAPPAHAAVTEAWVQRYNGPSNLQDHATAVAVDGRGNVVVTGRSASGPGDGYPCCPTYDYYTAKYAGADGVLLWERRYNGLGNDDDWAQAVAVDGSGNVVVTGSSYNGTNSSDFYTAKYAAADGALLWEKRYNGPANRDDGAQAVTVDLSGNVVVTGSSYNGTNGYDYYTAKYAAADGALLWEKRSTNSVQAMAVDRNGSVVVTGSCYRGTNSDYYTAKYAAADGALLWERRYNGSANGDDYATAVAVDGNGNVVVTGSSYYGPAEDYVPVDYYTAKYAAADGALLWEKRYNGGGAHVMAVDGSGNVVVAGSSAACSCSRLYTAKYAVADGALLWEKRSDSPDFEAHAVATDGSGNVVVTGYANTNYYTAKYAAVNGALLWEKRYYGPANGYDSASSLALGPNGMVAVTGSSSGDYATVVYRDDVYPISIALVPAGVRLRFTGIPSRSYTIERALAVTGPWSMINTQAAPLSGLFEYIDTNAPPGSAFYRTAQP